MKKFVQELVLTLSVALFASATCSAGFAKYVDITIQNYTGNEVANFPVLVKIDATKIPGVYTDVKNAGADMKFTDATGVTEYPYDVDVWDSTGTSLVWVKVPNLANGATFRMYYGDASQTVNEGSTGVWTGYAGVWHLSTGLGDSAEGGTTAVAVSPTAPLAAGAIGAGYKISPESVTSGSKTGAIYCPGTASVDYSAGFTLSLWMNNVSYSGNWDQQLFFATIGEQWEKEGGFMIMANNYATSGTEAYVYNSYTGAKFFHSAGRLWDNNVWHLYSVVYDGARVKSYVDGLYGGDANNNVLIEIKKRGLPLTLGNYSNADYSKIGSESSPGISWKGGVDECRFTTAVKSVDWLRAEYLVATTDVTTFGEPQEAGPTVQVLPQGVIVK